MTKAKYTRINLFNTLVCPDEISSGEISFNEWWNNVQNEEDYLTKRSYQLLDFYSAFRKIYNFFYLSDPDNKGAKIRKLYCDFSEDSNEMILTVKYKKDKDIDPSFYEAVSTFFDIDPGDTYNDFDFEPPGESHNSLKLIFRKKG